MQRTVAAGTPQDQTGFTAPEEVPRMTTLKPFATAILSSTLLLGAACASQPTQASGKEYSSSTETRHGTITAIDSAQRLVTIQADDGKTTTVRAGEEIRNFPQLQVGDIVTLMHHKSVVVALAPAGSGEPGAYKKTETELAQEGAKPGKADKEIVTVLAPIVAVDVAANTVSVRMPDDQIRVLEVKRPEYQQKLKDLKVGDMLRATFTEMKAVSITPNR
jgi:excinuclease UvrABC ATPase subunit